LAIVSPIVDDTAVTNDLQHTSTAATPGVRTNRIFAAHAKLGAA
jgi:hypothetical protein